MDSTAHSHTQAHPGKEQGPESFRSIRALFWPLLGGVIYPAPPRMLPFACSFQSCGSLPNGALTRQAGDVPSTNDGPRKDMANACRLVFPPVVARRYCTSNSLSFSGQHAPFINAAQYASIKLDTQ
jgi:hypothetical protein